MRPEEAFWIGEALRDAEGPVLELGSSTGHFRTVAQPHIDACIGEPLRARGLRLVHSDLKAAEGVDVSGDFNDPAVRETLRRVEARTILCCNMFEHVEDRPALARLCDELLQPAPRLVISVPHSYPLHADPIDTYFRPSPAQIAAMFPAYDIQAEQVVTSQTYLQSILTHPNPRAALAEVFKKLLKVWVGPRAWLMRNHRLLWLFRPYRIAVVVLRKP